MIYLAFDLGLSHTGVAVSHEGQLAEPLLTIEQKDSQKLFVQLASLVNVHKPDTVVIGQPSRGAIHDLANQLFDYLSHNLSPLPDMVLINEDKTTSDVERHFLTKKSTLHHRKQNQHQAAAALLLQEYLDSL